MPAVKTGRKCERTSATHPTHRFGAHLSIAGGMHNAIAEARRLRFETIQVFVKNQRQWRAAPLRDEDVARWHELRSRPGFGPVVAHATYLINLASPDRGLASRSVAAFVEELRRCETLGIAYLVVHPGAALGAETDRAVRRVSASLNRAFAAGVGTETMVLLETTAGQGSALGRSFAELGGIIEGAEHPERVGVCVDTCHVFAAGYDLRDPGCYAAMIREAAGTVGLERIRCWHMNDSKGDLGSRLDRHEHIGRGCIGSAGFRNVLGDGRFRGLPMIIETPKGTDHAGREWDRVNVARLRSIARRAWTRG